LSIHRQLCLVGREGQLKEAASVKFKAMEACEKANDTRSWIYHAVDYLELLEWQDKKEEVRVFIPKLEAVVNTAKQKNRDYTFTNVMGKVETKLKNYTTANSIFQVALKLEYARQSLDTNIVIYILQNMTKLYMAQGNLYKAEKTNNELVELKLKFRDNRLTKDSRLILTEAKAAFDLEQKELQIALSEEKRKQQNNLLIGAIILAVLLGSFLFILQRNKRHIEQQKIELEKLNATKNRLFALLSHDLLSPIANLKNVMMLVDWQLLSQEEFTATSKDLTNKVNNLYNMFENVLHWSISQMHGIRVNKETVKVKEIVDEQITLLKPFAKSKNIHISTDIPTDFDFTVDRNHLALILRNLLQNALKFTPNGGSIVFTSENTEGGKKLTI
jgi:signal transduction histidine kinase